MEVNTFRENHAGELRKRYHVSKRSVVSGHGTVNVLKTNEKCEGATFRGSPYMYIPKEGTTHAADALLLYA